VSVREIAERTRIGTHPGQLRITIRNHTLFDSAKKRTDAGEFVMSSVLKQSGRFKCDLPIARA
jgi:hypothetical protein